MHTLGGSHTHPGGAGPIWEGLITRTTQMVCDLLCENMHVNMGTVPKDVWSATIECRTGAWNECDLTLGLYESWASQQVTDI